jgi:hypothetical protein
VVPRGYSSTVGHLTESTPCNSAVSGTGGGVQYIAYGELDVTPVAGFTLTLNQPGGPPSVTPPSLGTAQANYPINVTTQNGYTGTVNFTAAFTGNPVPQGVSFYAIGSVYIGGPGGSGSTTVTANVPPGVAAGQYGFTITGADSTGATHSVNEILIIQQGADFTLSVSPAQNIQQGQSASYQISMAPAGAGFSGTVTLSMGAITGGVTGSLSTTVISPGSPATLTLNAANSATLGTYPILVNGTATSGSISHSVLATLGVAMSTSPGGTATAGGTVTIGTVAVPPGVPAGITVSSPVLLGPNQAVCSMSQGSTGITATPNVGTQTITFTATSSAGPATATCTTGAPEPAPQYVQVPCLPEDLIDLSVAPDGPGVWEFDVSSADPDDSFYSIGVSTNTRSGSYYMSATPDGTSDNPASFTVTWLNGDTCGTYNVAVSGYFDDGYDASPIYANASAGYLCYEAPPPPPQQPSITVTVGANDNPLGPLVVTVNPTEPIVYGGSQPSTSDSLTLTVPNPVPGVSYVWSVTGPGSGSYTPPPALTYASLAPVVWGIQQILPTAGVLTFAVTAQYPGEASSSMSSVPVEVGIRTDDVIVVGWINPAGVPSPDPSQATSFTVLNGMPPSGSGNSAFCNAEVGTLSQNGLLDPISGIGLKTGDRTYILDWMFKFSGNTDPAQVIPGGAFLDATGVAADPAKVSAFTAINTNYKLVNRFQVKMRITMPLGGVPYFTVPPTILQGQSMQLIGTTVNPCGAIAGQFLGSFPGQSGARNAFQVSSATGGAQFNNSMSIINDGSPDANAIEAFNTLAGLETSAPVFWESIGSRITVTATSGTAPLVTVQPYPTYYVYVNGRQTSTYPEATDPHNQFQPSPYPFGTVSCTRLYGTVPGGRCGDAVSVSDSTARIPPAFCITGSNGSCN